MHKIIGRVLFAIAIAWTTSPNLAFADAAGCVRHPQQFTEAMLIAAMIASGAALMFRRRKIDWRDDRRGE